MGEHQSLHITIDGRQITLSAEDPFAVEQMAEYINQQIEGLKEEGTYNRVTEKDKQLLLLLRMAEDVLKYRKKAEVLESQLTEMEDGMEQLRRDLVRERLKQEGT